VNKLEGKTVLVTGASGFIGSHLVNRLATLDNTRLLALSRKNVYRPNKTECVVSPLDQLTPQKWYDHGIDNIDVVFHLGAFTPKEASDVDREEEVYRDNLVGTRALLESLPKIPEKIVFASTIDIYARPLENTILHEDSKLGPAGLYGASKLFLEQLIKSYAKQYSCAYAILRCGHIFGPGEETYFKLIPQLIRDLLDNRPPTLYGDGSTKRDLLYVADAVEAFIRAAILDHKKLGPINVVRGKSESIRDIAEMLIKITDFKGEIEYLKDKPVGSSFLFDNKMMRDALGVWEFVSLQTGLERELQYFRGMQK